MFDVIGVVHNGVQAYPGVINLLNNIPAFQEIIFLSNNPRPGETTIDKIKSLGLTRQFRVLTSGDVTRMLLTNNYNNQKIYHQKIYHWGSERNGEITAGLSLNLVASIEECDLVLLTAFLEPNETECHSRQNINKIIHHKKPVLCANPDKVAVHGSDLRRCAGYLAAKIKEKNGLVQLVGKPDCLIYEVALGDYPHIHTNQILMIGDTLETDILGAKMLNIDQYLVLTGNTGNEINARDLTLDQYLVQYNLKAYAPTYYGNSLI